MRRALAGLSAGRLPGSTAGWSFQPLALGVPLLLALAIVLGGATRPGALGDVGVQLAAVPLLLLALPGVLEQAQRRWLGLAALAAASVLLVASVLAGAPLNQVLTPWLALMPPLAVFLATLLLDARQRFVAAATVTGLAAFSVLLGLVQVAQGPDSALRLFAITNEQDAVGFFANRNHFAALLYTAVPLCAVWLTLVLGATPTHSRGWLRSPSLVSFAGALTVLAMLVAGLALARSRAGVVLAIAAMLAALLIALSNRKGSGPVPVLRLAAGTLVFAGLFAAQLGLERVLARFDKPMFEDLRVPVAATTWDTAVASLPWGTGLGSFVPAYAKAERTPDVFAGWVNRAHNDYLEFFLEGGLLALAVMAGFLVWFGWRFYDAWLGRFSGHDGGALLLAKAGSVSVLLLLAHSAVDYPLRTAGLATLFAFAAALTVPPLTPVNWPAAQLAEPPHRSRRRRSSAPDRARDRAHQPSAPHAVGPVAGPVASPPERPALGGDVAWPAAWSARPGRQ